MNIVIDLRPLMGGKMSGVEVYLQNLVKNILEIDTENIYILYANASEKQNISSPFIHYGNVIIVQTRIPNKIFNLTVSLWRRPKIDQLILRFIKKKYHRDLKKIDVFFMPDLRPGALSKNVKKITVVHDLSFHHFPEFFSKKTRWWYRILQPFREINESDHIIAVSHFTKTDLIKTYQIPAEKITVIHEGIEENFGKEKIAKKSDIEEKYQIPEQYFLFLSTLEPRKNMVRLIEAFHFFKNRHLESKLKLVMAGQRNEKIFSTVKINQTPDIHFTGFIDEEDKAGLMKKATAFLYPSLFEGFGLPLMEAMKCETPIITSQSSSMPEICEKAALYIDPENIDDLVSAMEKIQTSKTREELKKEMRVQIQKFSWKKCAEETLKVISCMF